MEEMSIYPNLYSKWVKLLTDQVTSYIVNLYAEMIDSKWFKAVEP